LRTTSNLTTGEPQPSTSEEAPPLDALVRGVAAPALECVGARDGARKLASLGPLGDSANQLAAVRTLGRGILAADVAAVRATEEALVGWDNTERVQVIAALGARSSTAAQQTEHSLAPLVGHATRQTHIASTLIDAAREVVGGRHAERHFVYWVSDDPDGFCRFAWAAALQAAGARIWDRNWQRLTAQLDTTTRHRSTSLHDDPTRSEALADASVLARDAAIRSLVESALSDDQTVRRRAWVHALEAAERTPGTVAWVRYTQEMRAQLPPASWTTTNNLIGDHVSVIVNELPWIAGFVGMIALAAEIATSAARSGAVIAGARAMAKCDDFADALAAARARSGNGLARTA
jgi:hypothetical protein